MIQVLSEFALLFGVTRDPSRRVSCQYKLPRRGLMAQDYSRLPRHPSGVACVGIRWPTRADLVTRRTSGIVQVAFTVTVRTGWTSGMRTTLTLGIRYAGRPCAPFATATQAAGHGLRGVLAHRLPLPTGHQPGRLLHGPEPLEN